jgi:PAS domain S-box-containing protein
MAKVDVSGTTRMGGNASRSTNGSSGAPSSELKCIRMIQRDATSLSSRRAPGPSSTMNACLRPYDRSLSAKLQTATANPLLAIAACWYWTWKLQGRYIVRVYATALDTLSKAQGLLPTSSSLFEKAEYHFFTALSQAAGWESLPTAERRQHEDALAAHHKRLQAWAENCAENFANLAALIGAEIARLERSDDDAMTLYEQAIRSARDNGFIHNKAIAYERASDFCRARTFDQIADLYLRNAHYTVFMPSRIAVLKLIASLAAVALENTRLYADLEQREAKIRRLIDANIIGIFVWELEGRILEANDAFLRMVGYDREDLASGRLQWTDLTPPEWLDRDARAIEELKITATVQPYEKEYFRKDGSRVSVLIDGATFEEDVKEGVTFVLDLTQVRQSEQRYREMEIELAHANRVATMGQLTSIAHEVNQPIAAAVINAQAALRWLDWRPPDLEEVRQALGRIVEHGNRAADVIGRIRALIKKAPPRKDRLEINQTIGEVIELTHGEAAKNGVLVQTELAAGLPLIYGDRVQLKQVILNLIINAIEAMSRVSEGARELLISTRQADAGGVLVAVQDSGPGLAPATLERLFEPFYTTKPSGLGLGLSICRSIIEGHGGRLWASANVPRGTVFQFTVPHRPDVAS